MEIKLEEDEKRRRNREKGITGRRLSIHKLEVAVPATRRHDCMTEARDLLSCR